MSQKVQVVHLDDLDGGSAEESVSFAHDGVSYEIDLNKKNAAKLRDALATYVGSARKVTAARGTARRGRRTAGTPKVTDTASVRAWARENGYEVNDRGRVSSEIVAAYEAAH